MKQHHLIPTNDLREHDKSPACWCNPSQDDEYPKVWIHYSMDGREADELSIPSRFDPTVPGDCGS